MRWLPLLPLLAYLAALVDHLGRALFTLQHRSGPVGFTPGTIVWSVANSRVGPTGWKTITQQRKPAPLFSLRNSLDHCLKNRLADSLPLQFDERVGRHVKCFVRCLLNFGNDQLVTELEFLQRNDVVVR